MDVWVYVLVCAWEYWSPKGPEAADPLEAEVIGGDEPVA